jgi:2-polyprenyl-3-methyl-5-hydroxy-6-metoxy-1,4-benzoquinol methylase
MQQPEYRQRLYRRYLETGGGDISMTTPEQAPAGLRDMLRHVIAGYFPGDKGAQIVDLGCGMGLLVYFARQAGFTNIRGVDMSPQMVAAARRLDIDGIEEGDAIGALESLDPESHEAVISFDVLEHLKRDEMIQLIDEVRRVLKPGGRWIIHTVNAEAPFFGRVRFGDLTHEQAFTQASLRQILLASDFSSIACYEDAPIPGRPAAMLRWLMWKIVRLPALFWLIAESGPAARHAILSQNLLAVAIK